uniref:O-methyltransferase n=1 Tax=Kwoniella pini CBS 10737 TaxID=1296096 RepID=A0A1B9I4E2_9TREE|nr:uncharacterized protein I206_03713 [Kwoniella pini CBS 10737]OCF50392.1 hypothetical protein I206_03713 [Kwoniella pini CBS 10737]
MSSVSRNQDKIKDDALPVETREKAPNAPTPSEVDDYLCSKLLHPNYGKDLNFKKGIERANENNIPKIQISPLQGQFLSILIKSINAERVLEIGTLAGYSTSFISRALPSNGQIDTLEKSELHSKIAKENFLESDLFPFPNLHLGLGLNLLKKLNLPEEGPYDLIFIDANKDQIKDYFIESLRLLRKGGIIIVDNAIRRGKILPSSKDDPTIDVEGLRDLYDWIENDNGKTVLTSGIQTVGEKSWE